MIRKIAGWEEPPSGYAGPCPDGPLKGRLLVHSFSTYRCIVKPADVGKSTAIEYQSGRYEYDEASRYWRWQDD